MRITIRKAALATLAVLALNACDLRREGEEPAPEASETPDTAETTPASEETPAAGSIIRNDIEDAPALIDVPPEPLELVIPFPDGGTDLSESAQRLLASVIESDAQKEGWPIVIGGHTDSAGNDRANLRASRARAEAVAAWLVERGIEDERIEVIAFGEQNPIAPNALPDGEPDEEGRAKNRRVEIRIAALKRQRRSLPENAAEDNDGA